MSETFCPIELDKAVWREMRRWWDAFRDEDTARSIQKLASEHNALRAELAQAKAENERLRKIVDAREAGKETT